MKNLQLLAGMAAFLGTLDGKAINVTSTDFRIWGNWGELTRVIDSSGEIAEYRYTSGTFALSASDTPELQGGAVSSPQQWTLASATLAPFSLSMNASAKPTDYWDWNGTERLEFADGHINISATTTTRFNVEGSEALVMINANSEYNYEENEQSMEMQINDLTTGAILLSVSNLDSNFPVSSSRYLLMDPSHEYELALSGWITATDAKGVWMNTSVQIISSATVPPPQSIPDSGSTLLLLGYGFTLLGVGRLSRFCCEPPVYAKESPHPARTAAR